MSPVKVARPLAPAVSVLIAIRPLPSMLVKASLKLALASNRGATTSKRLAGQAKLSSVTGPSMLRPARDDRDGDDWCAGWSRAQRPGTSRGLATAAWPLKPPLSLPLPSSATPTGPNGVASAMLLSAMSSAKLGSCERLVAAAAAAACRSGPS